MLARGINTYSTNQQLSCVTWADLTKMTPQGAPEGKSVLAHQIPSFGLGTEGHGREWLLAPRPIEPLSWETCCLSGPAGLSWHGGPHTWACISPLEGLLKHPSLGPTSRVSDSGGLQWGWRIRISSPDELALRVHRPPPEDCWPKEKSPSPSC